MAETHYVLTSDIELYPSSNLISRFLELISKSGVSIRAKYYPAVFTLHVFEIKDGVRVPETKTELQRLFKLRMAVPFHIRLCSLCHRIPETNKWKKNKESQHLAIFNVAKRTGRYRYWEPFYIGTKTDPPFDERLSWEGMRNKMTQGLITCAKWGFPLNTLDLRLSEKAYLDRIGKNSRFKNNLPGYDWAKGFLKRHKL
ncbi:hypothetical protein ILUMI_12638 [Ignelater luminosus]|uniref:Uncharacterized protein n=1 Tax=Ignelater luminosus TaxID=2038154 RepID=A0A8K0CZY9_IGNLU|nr:hypothetical protein ILUMI_12638 [Ignelater luminosus]